MSKHLPQELFDNFVGNLCGDTKTLKACSHAFRSLSFSTRPLLFRSLELGIKPGMASHTHRQKIEFFSANRALLSHVRELWIVGDKTDNPIEWLNDMQSSFFEAFGPITHLALSEIKWADLRSHVQDFLLQMDAVVDLQITSFSFPSPAEYARFLSTFPSVRTLDLASSEGNGKDTGGIALGKGMKPIELTIREVDDADTILAYPSVCLSSVEKFTCLWCEAGNSGFDKIFTAVAATVKHLSFTVATSCERMFVDAVDGGSFNLSTVPHLEKLQLLSFLDTAEWVRVLLSTLPKDPLLRPHIITDSAEKEDDFTERMAFWEAFADIL